MSDPTALMSVTMAERLMVERHRKHVGQFVGKTSELFPKLSEDVDMVNHPPHYTQHPSGVECITITEHYNFNIGNCIKYLWRSDHKNGLEDLKKAAWYLDREIQRLEKTDG